MRFKIAFRNILRNRRRSLLNVAMIAGGVTAVLLFRGFAHQVVSDLREITIKMQTGHFQVASERYWSKKYTKPKDALLNDYRAIQSELLKNPHVRSASGRLSFFGLLSLGDITLSARGVGLDPSAENEIGDSYQTIEGRSLKDPSALQVMVGSGLAQRLDIHAGSNVTVLTYTFDNVINALDLEVVGIFRTSVADFDDSTFVLPLQTAQRIVDTPDVDQIVVHLDQTERTDVLVAHFNRIFQTEKRPILVKGWEEIAVYYQQVASFFRTQNRITEFIILALLLLGVLNTIGMSVFERAGEIGTVRALGEKESSILWQFVLEGAVLGILGSFVGILVGVLGGAAISALDLPLVAPGATVPLRIQIAFFFGAFRDAILLSMGASIVAAFIPAVRAARMNIVEALRHNI